MSEPAGSDPGFTIPGYTDVRLIGHGGFSTVYYALQTQFERVVAVKVLDIGLDDERTRRQYQRECAATGRLSGHPNIVSIIDSGFTSTHKPYLTMDYFSQGSLGDRVKAFGPLPVHEVLRIGVKIAGALESAHQKDILHRDIKPENILVSGYGEPGLADFGIATVTAKLESSVTIHALTPNHAPPEVMEGKKATEQSDVYSFGSTLYELLAGRPAFNLGNDNSILAFLLRVLQEPVPPIPRQDVVTVVYDVLAAMMAKDPAARYQSAGAAGVALQQLQAHLGYPVTELVTFNPVPGALSGTVGTPTGSFAAAPGATPPVTAVGTEAAVPAAAPAERPTVPPIPTPMPVAPPPADAAAAYDHTGNATVLRPGAPLAGPSPGALPPTGPSALSGPSMAPPSPPTSYVGDLTGSATVAHDRHAPLVEVADLTAPPPVESGPPTAVRVLAILFVLALLAAAGYAGFTRLRNADVASDSTTTVPGSSTTTARGGVGPSTTAVAGSATTVSTPATDGSGSGSVPSTTAGPPEGVTVEVTGSDSIQVSWRDAGGGKRFYVYQVFSPQGQSLSKINAVTDGPSSQVIASVDAGPLTTASQTYCIAVGTVNVGSKPAWADAVCTDGSTIKVL